MADLKTTKEITAELEKQRALANDGRQSDATREARVQRIAALEKQLSDTLSEQIKARKIFNKLSADANKIEKDTSQSLISRLQSLAKGNVQAIFSNKSAEKQQSIQKKINIDAKVRADQLAKEVKIGTMGNESFTQTLSLVDRIKSGLVDREDIDNEILAINERGRDIAKGMSGELKQLADDKAEEVEEGKKAKEINEQQAKIVAQLGDGFTFLLSTATKFAGAIDKIGQTFGSLNILGKEVTNNLLESSVEATKLGGSIDDVASITNTLASNFGMSLEDASTLSAKVFDTSKALGLSSDESANLFGSLTQVANLSAEQAESLAEGAFQLARQRGIAPSAVLKDIAGSAEEIALFTRGGGDNIAEAAVQARSLGMSLSQTAKVAEGLLDFENSITKEVEASVLLGRQINLQKAREAALSGDVAGAMEEVVKQVGSEQDFLNLNLIQRKALADSIGVSVGEMAKLVGQSDKLTLSGAMASGNFENLLGEEGISNISKLTGQFAALGATLTNSLGPVLSVIVGGLNAMLTPVVAVIQGLEKMNALVPTVAAAVTGLATAYGLAKINILMATAAKKKDIAISAKSIVKTVGEAIAQYFKNAGLMGGATFGFGTIAGLAIAAAGTAAVIAAVAKARSVNDFHSSPGGITTMMGPAGIFSLNPRDSVLATTNPIPVRKVNEVGQNLSFGNAGQYMPVTNEPFTNGGGGEYVLRAEGNDLVARIAKGAKYAQGTPGDIV